MHEVNYFNHCGILFEIVQYDLNILDRSIIDFESFPLFISDFLSVLGIYVTEDSFLVIFTSFGILFVLEWLASYVLASMVAKVAASFKNCIHDEF